MLIIVKIEEVPCCEAAPFIKFAVHRSLVSTVLLFFSTVAVSSFHRFIVSSFLAVHFVFARRVRSDVVLERDGILMDRIVCVVH